MVKLSAKMSMQRGPEAKILYLYNTFEFLHPPRVEYLASVLRIRFILMRIRFRDDGSGSEL